MRTAVLLVAFVNLASASCEGARDLSVALYDVRYAESLSLQAGYEELHLVAAIAGLANRGAPRLYVFRQDADVTWWQVLTSAGGVLANATVYNITGIEQLVDAFSSAFSGVVLYDPSVWPTSLLASTSAGAEGLLPLCFRPADPTSLYNRLVAAGPRLPVQRSLVGLFNGSVTGSVKLDAYTWAVDTFLRPGPDATGHASGGQGSEPLHSRALQVGEYPSLNRGVSSPSVLAYYLDYFFTTQPQVPQPFEKDTLSNHDWFIANRAFFFDLSPWADVAPIDDPSQPLGSDVAALRLILGAAYNGTGGNEVVHIGGFVPWAYKYTDATHGGVQTEWATVQLTSAFNALVDADACCIGNMANAAFFAHFPLPERLVQTARAPLPQELVARGLMDGAGNVIGGGRLYYMLYFGDFDSAAWLYSQLWQRWQDAARGQVPIGWAIDPALALRFPLIFPLLYGSASPADVFISGDSGAGYLNPTQLYGPGRAGTSGQADARALWEQYNTAWYRQLDLTFTGFVITGDAPPMTPDAEAMYANWSANGLVNQQWPGLGTHLAGNMPAFVETDISDPTAAQTIADTRNASDAAPQFHVFRSVLQSPSWLLNVTQDAAALSGGQTLPLDPLTFAYLARTALGGSNNDRVTYVGDTLPAAAPAGAVLNFSVSIRNEGWNALPAANHSLLVQILPSALCRDGREPDAAPNGPGSLYGATSAGRGRLSANPAMRQHWARRGGRLDGHTAVKASAATPILVALPQDLALGGNVTIPVALQLPATSALGECVFPHGRVRASQLAAMTTTAVTIQYQLAATVDDGSTMLYSFDTKGVLPWQAVVQLE